MNTTTTHPDYKKDHPPQVSRAKPKLLTKEKELVGKTITKVRRLKRMGFCDRAWLELVFSDGTRAILEADRKGYSPWAVSEYPQALSLRKTDEGLARPGRARKDPVQEEQPPIVTGGTTWAKNSNYRRL